MGIDLRLLPATMLRTDSAFGHSVLQLDAWTPLFDAVQELHSILVPDEFNSFCSDDGKYEEPHYGQTRTDRYGDLVRMVQAGTLAGVDDELLASPRNRAAWAYVRALKPGDWIALYWH